MVGLILVTSAGLLATSLISAIVLHTFMMERLDVELQVAAARAVTRVDETVSSTAADSPSPSPYFVAVLDPATGAITNTWGDTPRPDVVLDRLDRYSFAWLLRRAGDGEIFDLEGPPSSVPAHRATVRVNEQGVIVVAIPTDNAQILPQQLVLIQLVVSGLLIAALALAGRGLIARGLAPLDRMATTADRISAGEDLSERMPGAERDSEAGRLAVAINTMLGRIEQAFQARLRSERRVRAFAADASHELRTPLTTIRGYAELYRQGAIPPDQIGGAMRRIESEAERMSRLVAELLELARLDRPGSLEFARTDLVPLVNDAVADAAAVEPARPLEVDVPDTLDGTIDETRFRQVLANLLANVREHTPPDTPTRVSLRRDEDSAVLEIADQGPGMPTEDAARVFDRFYRGRRTPTGGSGLGLSIVHAIAEAHGGETGLTTAPGEGTTVTVRVPLAQ
ncbi:two-component system OmpR family sensor kinase [Allonocardiopsis opalescens]|uniref:histidine kinase n=2 Tax=Allonocardiopsis opalescens TaxID=1144618 RepID=A0A2T0Q9R4_9ACTN|nr:two-component system OmpR family sensor kinase [Allonocardiopsis opalescens]